MSTASSLPPLSCRQHQPSHLLPSVPHALSCQQLSSSSGISEFQCLGMKTWSTRGARAPIRCSRYTRRSAYSFFHLARHSHGHQLEKDAPDSSDSHESCYFASSGRRMILFMSSVSFLLSPRSLAEMLDAAKLLNIQNSLRVILSKAKAAGMLRLAFHDAGTYDMEDHSGGMNGSILYELDRPENTGLSKSLKILEKAKEEINKIHQVSWADLIAVAGAEAVFLCGGPSISVKVGRVDVRKPDPAGKLPLETLNASGLKSCFHQKGFSTQELVALSGAHTLGSKGFGNPFVFDNVYYKILLEKPWATSGSMPSMIGLPSDHALVEDDECLRWIKLYAGDQAKFFGDFAAAYVKLVDSGAVWRAEET